ncbi:transposase [Piscirickettsia salmonis]|uniref:transposase n=1 Tax=Piscirickettsia salmonis TaxID=1238 RepID=UPI0012BA780F|nr:transposase [Piscirickettsia salmonis]
MLKTRTYLGLLTPCLALHGSQRWKVHFAQPKENHQHNVDYLGRYIKRPALANARMEHYDGNVVIFRYLDHKTKQQKMKKQSIDDFIDRLTQHIPDKFFKMIRYYGFLSYRTRTIILPKIYDLLMLRA